MFPLLATILRRKTDLNNRVISENLIALSVEASQAYLNAIASCTTPELRSLYLTNLNLILNQQSTLNKLAINKEWTNPYDDPKQQLKEAYYLSVHVTDHEE